MHPSTNLLTHCFFSKFKISRFYGAPDDLDRFMFFSRAALEFLLAAGKQPDIIHIHDWQAAAVVGTYLGGCSCRLRCAVRCAVCCAVRGAVHCALIALAGLTHLQPAGQEGHQPSQATSKRSHACMHARCTRNPGPPSC